MKPSGDLLVVVLWVAEKSGAGAGDGPKIWDL